MFQKLRLAPILCLGAVACNYPANFPTSGLDDAAGAQPLPTQPQPQPQPQPAPTATTLPPGPAPTPAPRPTATTSGKPIALVYGGPGVLTGTGDTLDMAEYVAQQAGFQVIEVTQPVDSATLDSASVWIQPGGPNLSADSYMNGNGMADQVRDFVRRGGGYVGFCGGAFSAVNNLGLIPGSAWNLNQTTGKIPVTWLGAVRYIHFEHGPYFNLADKSSEIVATYANGSVAATRGFYGKGKVFISGVHPEASKYWPPTADPDGLDQDLAIGMIREVASLPAAQ